MLRLTRSSQRGFNFCPNLGWDKSWILTGWDNHFLASSMQSSQFWDCWPGQVTEVPTSSRLNSQSLYCGEVIGLKLASHVSFPWRFKMNPWISYGSVNSLANSLSTFHTRHLDSVICVNLHFPNVLSCFFTAGSPSPPGCPGLVSCWDTLGKSGSVAQLVWIYHWF